MINFGLRGSLRLDGDSTLHRFSARTADVRGAVQVDAEGPSTDVAALVRAGQVKLVDLSVPVEKLRSGESNLDTSLWKALKSGQFSEIRLRADSFELRPTSVAGASFGVAMRGTLTVAGATRAIGLEAAGFAVAGGVRFTGSTTLRMTSYGIKPPTMMLGAIKTADPVTVTFDVELRSSG